MTVNLHRSVQGLDSNHNRWVGLYLEQLCASPSFLYIHFQAAVEEVSEDGRELLRVLKFRGAVGRNKVERLKEWHDWRAVVRNIVPIVDFDLTNRSRKMLWFSLLWSFVGQSVRGVTLLSSLRGNETNQQTRTTWTKLDLHARGFHSGRGALLPPSLWPWCPGTRCPPWAHRPSGSPPRGPSSRACPPWCCACSAQGWFERRSQNQLWETNSDPLDPTGNKHTSSVSPPTPQCRTYWAWQSRPSPRARCRFWCLGGWPG